MALSVGATLGAGWRSTLSFSPHWKFDPLAWAQSGNTLQRLHQRIKLWKYRMRRLELLDQAVVLLTLRFQPGAPPWGSMASAAHACREQAERWRTRNQRTAQEEEEEEAAEEGANQSR